MKLSFAALAILGLGCVAVPAKAQTISVVGGGVISTLPGSPTDYIFFNSSTFSNQASHNVAGYSDLTDFSFSGGVFGQDPSPTSQITAPGGLTPVTTGVLQANTAETSGGNTLYQLAVGILSTGSSNFNYNDFNVYVMYSNTLGAYDDSGILLESESDYFNDTNNGFFTNTTPVTDTNTNSNEAYVVEFNVQGYAADFANGDFLALGATTANQFPGAYVGGIAFESAPEPSTYVLLLAGLGALAFGGRFSGIRFPLRSLR